MEKVRVQPRKKPKSKDQEKEIQNFDFGEREKNFKNFTYRMNTEMKEYLVQISKKSGRGSLQKEFDEILKRFIKRNVENGEVREEIVY